MCVNADPAYSPLFRTEYAFSEFANQTV